jgi:hypothetical protein
MRPEEIIPNPIDQNWWAQSRRPRDIIRPSPPPPDPNESCLQRLGIRQQVEALRTQRECRTPRVEQASAADVETKARQIDDCLRLRIGHGCLRKGCHEAKSGNLEAGVRRDRVIDNHLEPLVVGWRNEIACDLIELGVTRRKIVRAVDIALS